LFLWENFNVQVTAILGRKGKRNSISPSPSTNLIERVQFMLGLVEPKYWGYPEPGEDQLAR
jgi:hypothetical protein